MTKEQLEAVGKFVGSGIKWEIDPTEEYVIIPVVDGSKMRIALSEILPKSLRKDDLTTRKRVQVVLDRKLYAQLQAYSSKTHKPVSRLLDQAIEAFLKVN